MIVAGCFIGFILFSRKSLGQTFKVTFDARMEAIQEELQQVPNPNEVILLESKEQERLLRISLQICGTGVESLPTARCARLDEIVTSFHVSVSERFVPGSTSKAFIVELIREGLVVLRKVRV
ncbi:hypothetical protein MKW98_025849 [Papaver atlanticum]|uniref:ATP synthase protein MI25 n=1 Tax=Papaver atlanticum TaxID=357466 RepID=A0AAD4X423_9MAGN|nr:hypothetical protein MKW98_025849 [Papaver atlanticum]